MIKHFEVTICEIPNSYIKRLSYKKTYKIAASSNTEAKQHALDMFGDWSQVKSCIEFDREMREAYPEEEYYEEN
jgi:hypothetical protein